ncbi:phage major capsid protein [Nocardia sp. NPDC046763]|uniref:phage major capsid protein n=1 Tax=Nocardia sp. NPDC046763 TaxID=3155256 RepID=UPI0033D5FB34
MNALDIVRARLAELRTEIQTHSDKRGAILDAAALAKRGLTDAEQADYDAAGTARAAAEAQVAPLVEREAELVAEEQRETAQAHARVQVGQADTRSGGASVTDAPVYERGNHETSYFRDLYLAQRTQDGQAAERLRRSDAQIIDAYKRRAPEARALNTAPGTIGEFAPPLWMVAEFVKLARPGRVFADSLNPMTLPKGVSSVNIPKVGAGTLSGLQSAQNTALPQQDMKSTSISSGISTHGGKQVISLQLIQQSGINIDEVIVPDLAAAYAQDFNNAAVNGAGSPDLMGVLTQASAGPNNVTFTSASPAPGAFYSKVMGAIQSIATTLFRPADTIYMHPRRWYWLLAQTDSQGRPLVVPSTIDTVSMNAMGDGSADVPQGTVGRMGGLPVVTDPLFPTTLGAGNNQDCVLVARRAELRLWEGQLNADTQTAPYADSLGVLFRAWAYSAAIHSRYPQALARIDGTGLVAPTF